MLIKREDEKSLESLTPGSKKKVIFICEYCQEEASAQYRNYRKQEEKLCRKCRNKKTANSPEVKEKQSKSSKERWKDEEYRTKVSENLSKAQKYAWDNKRTDRTAHNKREYETVLSEVHSHGLELNLTKEDWENNHYNTVWVYCPYHPFNVFQFRKGHGCKYCSGKKIDSELYKAQCDELGYTFNGIKNGKIYFICFEGHESSVTLANWKEGSRCPYCSGRKVYNKDILSEIENYGWVILSDNLENINTKTQIEVQCPVCRTKKYISYSRISKCETCARNNRYERIKKEFENEGYTVKEIETIERSDSSKYYYKVYFICPNGHHHNILTHHWKNGQRCAYCHLDRLNEQVKERLKYADDLEFYNYLVDYYTRKNWVFYHEYINPDNLPRDRNYHLDHKYSKYQGFLDGILPQIIGSPVNLQMLPCEENTSKHSNCWISQGELFEMHDTFMDSLYGDEQYKHEM